MLKRNVQAARASRGLSLVELMVGIAIGLIIVAAASLAVSSQLGENRRLLIETQLQQDLRASSDIIARELRRAGAQRDLFIMQSVWRPGMAETTENFSSKSLSVVSSSQVSYTYQPTLGLVGFSQFKLDNGVIKQQQPGNSVFQELTDKGVMNVTHFSITSLDRPGIDLQCPTTCVPNGTTSGTRCPRTEVRELQISITAEAKGFPEVSRTIISRVRLRNDYVRYSVAVPGASTQICPP